MTEADDFLDRWEAQIERDRRSLRRQMRAQRVLRAVACIFVLAALIAFAAPAMVTIWWACRAAGRPWWDC